MNAADSVVVIHASPDRSPATQAALEEVAVATLDRVRAGDVVIDAAPKREMPADWPANAVLQLDGSVILTLEWPVVFRLREADGTVRDGDSYRQLHLKRLKGKHKSLLMGAKDNVDFEKVMLGCSTGLDVGKVELLHGEMDQADIAAMLRVTRFFTTPGRRTGPAS